MSSDEESPQLGREKFTIERSSSEINSDCHESNDTSFFGPILPPHLLGKKDDSSESSKIIGPIMPSYIRTKVEDPQICDLEVDEKTIIGPKLPVHLMSQSSEKKIDEISLDDDNDFGPSPNLMATEDTFCYYGYTGERKPKEKSATESSSKRETWMLELPEERAAKFGLGPRQFKTRILTEKERDRSVWTESPADRIKDQCQPKDKVKDHNQELETKRLEERNKEMEKLAKKAAKKAKKQKSLMEIHLKNMKKKKKKDAKKEKQKEAVPERRPFDRNIDLQVHRFDERKKRAFLSKTHFLNDRFASGESKYL